MNSVCRTDCRVAPKRGAAQRRLTTPSIQQGFTLLEMIIVIVIIGILSVSVTRFMTQSVSGYLDTAARQRVALAASAAGEQIVRRLATALPNSVRVGGNCLEWIPVVGQTYYETVPLGTASSSFQIVSNGTGQTVSGRAVVNPAPGATLYQPSNPGSLSSAIATLPGGPDAVTLTFSGTHQFLSDSPSRRLFIVASPESYCVAGNALVHYWNYGFNMTLATPPAGGNSVIALTGMQPGTFSFRYSPASAVSGERVSFRFRMADNDANRGFEQEVHLRYVP